MCRSNISDKPSPIKPRKKTNIGIIQESESEGEDKTELTKLEIDLAKQNFGFYDLRRQGYVERFELLMLLTGKPHNAQPSCAQPAATILTTKL